MRQVILSMFKQKGYDCYNLASLDDLDITEINYHFKVVVSDLLFQGVSSTEYVVNLKEVLKFDRIFIVTTLGQEKIKRAVSRLTTIDGYYDYPVDLNEIETQI